MIDVIQKITVWFRNKNAIFGYRKDNISEEVNAHKFVEVGEMLVDKVNELIVRVNDLEQK